MKYHIVQRDETLAYIAYKYDTTVEKIVELNPNLNKYPLYIGQEIRVK